MNQLKKYSVVLTTFSLFLLGCSGTKELSSASTNTSSSLVSTDETIVQEVFIEATKAKILEDYELAVKLYQKCIKLDAGNHASMYELANIYFRAGDYDLALVQMEQAVKLNEQNKWYNLLHAEILSYKGKYEDAAAVYEKLIDQNPNEMEFYFDWAFMLIKAEKFEAAIKVYDAFEKKVGLEENIIVQKQKLYIRIGKAEKAAAELQKLIDSDPSNSRYYRMLADLYKANDMNDKAGKVYQRLLEMDPDNPNALLYLAEMNRIKGNHEEAIRYLKQAFTNPELSIDAKVRILFPYLQSLMVEDSSRKEEAFSLANLIIEAHPEEAKAHAIYGDLLYQDKQLDEATAQYKLALELDSSVYEIWQQLFFIDSELRNNEDLEKITDAAMELFPNQPMVYFFNGVSKNQLKKHEEAIEILHIGEPLVIDNPLLKAQIYATLGDAYNSIDNYEMSDSSFVQSLKYDPDNSYVLNNFSYYLSLRDDALAKAKKMSFRANELEPKNSAFQDTYAWILYRMSEYREAKKWIEKSIENGGETNSVILDHYGDILFKLGDIDKAIVYWREAKVLDPKSELIGRKIADRQLYEE